MKVYYTVDTEVWCGGWDNLDERFPDAFKRYVYGPTNKGDYGLTFQLKVLNDHGLKGVFFVEPLFARRFGMQPLEEIVGLIQSTGHKAELHLHTEWVDEFEESLFPEVVEKRQHLRYFDLDQQTTLIGLGKALLKKAGVNNVRAFRAGSFAFNANTLKALAANDIAIDSSYNATQFGADSGIASGRLLFNPEKFEDILELPMTVFRDGLGRLRHLQLTACAWREIENVLWNALEQKVETLVLLSHNFELLNQQMNTADPIVVKRFRRLCEFLERHSDCFETGGFESLNTTTEVCAQHDPIAVKPVATYSRLIEQAWRRVYR